MPDVNRRTDAMWSEEKAAQFREEVEPWQPDIEAHARAERAEARVVKLEAALGELAAHHDEVVSEIAKRGLGPVSDA